MDQEELIKWLQGEIECLREQLDEATRIIIDLKIKIENLTMRPK